jgi:hypothetical protein
MPNEQDFKGAGQGDNREVVDLYDAEHGKYVQQKPAVADSNMPSPPEPDPFTIKSSK